MPSVEFTCSVSERETAIQASGRLEGGGRITFDIPDSDMGALAMMMALRRVPLLVTVEVLPERATVEPAAKEKPEWASRKK